VYSESGLWLLELENKKLRELLVCWLKKIVPIFGMPEALLPDRETNLLSHLMKDMYALLGIKKLNTTAHSSSGM